jgi:hypothetical protein
MDKVYGTKPEENERADLSSARHIHFAIEHIDKTNEWLKTTKEPAQSMLLHIDVLLLLIRRFPANYVLIKKDKVLEWESTF